MICGERRQAGLFFKRRGAEKGGGRGVKSNEGGSPQKRTKSQEGKNAPPRPTAPLSQQDLPVKHTHKKRNLGMWIPANNPQFREEKRRRRHSEFSKSGGGRGGGNNKRLGRASLTECIPIPLCRFQKAFFISAFLPPSTTTAVFPNVRSEKKEEMN